MPIAGFQSDAAHGLVLLERARVVLDGEGKVKLLLTEVVGLSVIAQPCQLKAESGRTVAEEEIL